MHAYIHTYIHAYITFVETVLYIHTDELPHLQVEYGPAVDWAKISKSFFRKEKEYAMRAQERREKVEKELEVERTYATYSSVDSSTGSVMQVKAPLKQQLTKEEEREFFNRMEQRMQRAAGAAPEALGEPGVRRDLFLPAVHPPLYQSQSLRSLQ